MRLGWLVIAYVVLAVVDASSVDSEVLSSNAPVGGSTEILAFEKVEFCPDDSLFFVVLAPTNVAVGIDVTTDTATDIAIYIKWDKHPYKNGNASNTRELREKNTDSVSYSSELERENGRMYFKLTTTDGVCGVVKVSIDDTVATGVDSVFVVAYVIAFVVIVYYLRRKFVVFSDPSVHYVTPFSEAVEAVQPSHRGARHVSDILTGAADALDKFSDVELAHINLNVARTESHSARELIEAVIDRLTSHVISLRPEYMMKVRSTDKHLPLITIRPGEGVAEPHLEILDALTLALRVVNASDDFPNIQGVDNLIDGLNDLAKGIQKSVADKVMTVWSVSADLLIAQILELGGEDLEYVETEGERSCAALLRSLYVTLSDKGERELDVIPHVILQQGESSVDMETLMGQLAGALAATGLTITLHDSVVNGPTFLSHLVGEVTKLNLGSFPTRLHALGEGVAGGWAGGALRSEAELGPEIEDLNTSFSQRRRPPKNSKSLLFNNSQRRPMVRAKTLQHVQSSGAILEVDMFTTVLVIVVIIFLRILGLVLEIVRVLINVSLLYSAMGAYIDVSYTTPAELGALFNEWLPSFGFVVSFPTVWLLYMNQFWINIEAWTWNCGGMALMIGPVMVLSFTAVVYHYLLEKDLLLYLAVRTNVIALDSGLVVKKIVKAVSAGVVNMCFALMQVILVCLVNLFTGMWSLKRTCSPIDHALRDVMPYLIFPSLAVFIPYMFILAAGPPVHTYAHSSAIVRYARIIYDGFKRIVQMTFGIWTTDLATSLKVVERAEYIDDDPDDPDNQHETVLVLLARSRAAIWMAFPFTIFLSKLAEALNDPVAVSTAADVRMRTGFWKRFFYYLMHIVQFLLTVAVVATATSQTALLLLLSLGPTWIVTLVEDVRKYSHHHH